MSSDFRMWDPSFSAYIVGDVYRHMKLFFFKLLTTELMGKKLAEPSQVKEMMYHWTSEEIFVDL